MNEPRVYAPEAYEYGAPVYQEAPHVILRSPTFRVHEVIGIRPKVLTPDHWEVDLGCVDPLPYIRLGEKITYDGIPLLLRDQHVVHRFDRRGYDIEVIVQVEWSKDTDHRWHGEEGYQLALRAGMHSHDAEMVREYGTAGPPGPPGPPPYRKEQA